MKLTPTGLEIKVLGEDDWLVPILIKTEYANEII